MDSGLARPKGLAPRNDEVLSFALRSVPLAAAGGRSSGWGGGHRTNHLDKNPITGLSSVHPAPREGCSDQRLETLGGSGARQWRRGGAPGGAAPSVNGGACPRSGRPG